jgi:hypothetical protein
MDEFTSERLSKNLRAKGRIMHDFVTLVGFEWKLLSGKRTAVGGRMVNDVVFDVRS